MMAILSDPDLCFHGIGTGAVKGLDATQRFGVGLPDRRCSASLVADQSRRSVHRVGVAAAELELAFGRVTNNDRAVGTGAQSRYPRSMM